MLMERTAQLHNCIPGVIYVSLINMDPTEQMLNHYDAACKISRESTIYDQLGSHFASMNQYEKPSESNAQHKSLMRERRSMPQYDAVSSCNDSVAIEKDIYYSRHACKANSTI